MYHTVLETSYIYRFGCTFARFWRSSVLFSFFSMLSGAFRESLLGRWLYHPAYGVSVHSIPVRMGYRINLFLNQIGKKFNPVFQDFCLARLWRYLRDQSVAGKSFFLGRLILQQGFHRVFLGLFALYLPLDVLLRALPLPSLIPSLWDEAFLLFGLGYAFLRPIAIETPVRPRVSIPGLFLLLFCAVGVLLLGFVSPSTSIAISGYRAVFQYLLWFYVVIRLLDTEEDILALLKVFVATGTLIGLHGIYQYIIGVEIPSTWVSSLEEGVRTRAFSIIGSPNILGDLMVLLAPLAASLAYSSKKLSRQLFYWGCVCVMGLCCVVTFSRGAWVGFAVAVFLFALLRDRRLFLIMLLVAAAALCIPEIYNRVAFLFTPEFAYANSRGGRGSRWVIGLDLLNEQSNPLLGFGLGRFGGAVAMQNQTVPGLQYFYMDNYYLKTLVEMGYLGLGSYLLTVAVTILSGLRSYFLARTKVLKNTTVAVFSAMCGVLVHCYFENIFEVPYMSAYFWGLAAILIWAGLFPDGKRTSSL